MYHCPHCEISACVSVHPAPYPRGKARMGDKCTAQRQGDVATRTRCTISLMPLSPYVVDLNIEVLLCGAVANASHFKGPMFDSVHVLT